MKRQADLLLDDEKYKRIGIWYIYNDYKRQKKENNYEYDLKQFYNDYYKGKLYSTHYKIERKKKLSLNIKHPYGNSFFRYYPGQSSHCSEETIPHEMFKDIISGFSKLVLRVDRKDIILYVSEGDIEHKFHANGNIYYADIYFKFFKSEPEEYYYKWNGEICFEIMHTHKVGEKKKFDCLKEGIAVFEHPISTAYIDLISNIYNEQSEFRVVKKITEDLQDYIKGSIISNPETEEYIMIKKLQKEIEDLKQDNNMQLCMIEDLNNKIRNIKFENKSILSQNNQLEKFKSTIFEKKIFKLLLKIYGIK